MPPILPSQVIPVLLLQNPGSPRQRQLRHVVLVQALHQVVLGGGQRSLRGHQRQIVINPGIHAVRLVAQRAGGQLYIRLRHFYQLRRCANVQQCRPHLFVDVVAQIR